MAGTKVAGKTEAKKDDNLVEITVTVDNHTHAGKPCVKGDKVKVSPEVKAMLEKAWKKVEPEAGA